MSNYQYKIQKYESKVNSTTDPIKKLLYLKNTLLYMKLVFLIF